MLKTIMFFLLLVYLLSLSDHPSDHDHVSYTSMEVKQSDSEQGICV